MKFLCSFGYFSFVKLFVSQYDNGCRGNESEQVGNGRGVEHAVKAEEHRQKQRKAHAENYLSYHGKKC